LDPSPDAPAQWGTHRFDRGALTDYQTVLDFGRTCQSVVLEIEAVNAEALMQLEREGIPCFPPGRVLQILQNKSRQKGFFAEFGLPTSPFTVYESIAALHADRAAGAWPLPFVWKAATGGYDGFGVTLVRTEEQAQALPNGECLAEALVDLDLEVAVQVARTRSGETAVFPVTDMEFHPTANQVEFVVVPTRLSPALAAAAQELALKLVESLELVGLLSVEFFVDRSGHLWINEAAPRPHNSGHWTMNGSVTSQFEQHLRAVLDYPLGDTRAVAPVTVMANVLGAAQPPAMGMDERLHHLFGRIPDAHVHLYGKQERPGRKIGHVNVVGEDVAVVRERAEQAAHWLSHAEWTDGWDGHD
jgi:5-(carboxyamino)imidazole ribonucleotide synthase